MFRHSVATLAVAFLTAGAVHAHAKLLSASPAADSTNAAAAVIELHFSEPLMPAFSGLEVSMTSMPGMKMARPMMMSVKSVVSPDGMTMIGTPAKPFPAGTYQVNYHAVTPDTHRVESSFVFTVR